MKCMEFGIIFFLFFSTFWDFIAYIYVCKQLESYTHFVVFCAWILNLHLQSPLTGQIKSVHNQLENSTQSPPVN